MFDYIINNHIVLNEAKRDEIRNEISKEKTKFQPRNGGQKTTLQLTRVQLKSINKWRVNKKTTTRKKQASKIFLTKTQEYSPFSGNNQAFYSIADFSFHFTTVSERKVPF